MLKKTLLPGLILSLCFALPASAEDAKLTSTTDLVKQFWVQSDQTINEAQKVSFLTPARTQEDLNRDGRLEDIESFDENGDGVSDATRVDYNGDRKWDSLRVDFNKDWFSEVVMNDSDRSGGIEVVEFYFLINDIRDVVMGDLDENGIWDIILIDQDHNGKFEFATFVVGDIFLNLSDSNDDGIMDEMDTNGDGYAETSIERAVFNAFTAKLFEGKLKSRTLNNFAKSDDSDGDGILDKYDFRDDSRGTFDFYNWLGWLSEGHRNRAINPNLSPLDDDNDGISNEVDPSPKGKKVISHPNVTLVTSDDIRIT